MGYHVRVGDFDTAIDCLSNLLQIPSDTIVELCYRHSPLLMRKSPARQRTFPSILRTRPKDITRLVLLSIINPPPQQLQGFAQILNNRNLLPTPELCKCGKVLPCCVLGNSSPPWLWGWSQYFVALTAKKAYAAFHVSTYEPSGASQSRFSEAPQARGGPERLQRQ